MPLPRQLRGATAVSVSSDSDDSSPSTPPAARLFFQIDSTTPGVWYNREVPPPPDFADRGRRATSSNPFRAGASGVPPPESRPPGVSVEEWNEMFREPASLTPATSNIPENVRRAMAAEVAPQPPPPPPGLANVVDARLRSQISPAVVQDPNGDFSRIQVDAGGQARRPVSAADRHPARSTPVSMTSASRQVSLRDRMIDHALVRLGEVEGDVKAVRAHFEQPSRADRAAARAGAGRMRRFGYCCQDMCDCLGRALDNRCTRVLTLVIFLLLIFGLGNQLRLWLLSRSETPPSVSTAADGSGDPEDDLGDLIPPIDYTH
jgi:hypothetical protein